MDRKARAVNRSKHRKPQIKYPSAQNPLIHMSLDRNKRIVLESQTRVCNNL